MNDEPPMKSPYPEAVCDRIAARVLNRFTPHIKNFAKKRLRPEMREDFIADFALWVLRSARRGLPPLDECLVDGRIDWSEYSARIYGILKKRMNWNRLSLFERHYEKLEAARATIGTAGKTPAADDGKRAAASARRPPLPEPIFFESSEEEDGRQASHEELIGKLDQILSVLVERRKITELEQQAFFLRIDEELTFEQIGASIGKSTQTAKRYCDAVQSLLAEEETRRLLRDRFKGWRSES